VVLGFILNRLNVAITGFERSNGTPYFPSWNEISITLFLVTVGFIAFGMAAKYLPVFPHNHRR
jgi:Ni/Fe-hydrogenase subunit HybB-like protein